MSMLLKGKKILLGISGSIAAYKAAPLSRLFIKAGAEVQILMTEAATNFISPLTLSTLTNKAVFSTVHSEEGWNNHVEFGLWADAMIVAPATANTLSRMACGLCDNVVLAAYLSARCPVFVAPAMDVDMWKHPTTLRNIDQLQQDGVHVLPVEHGELASGLIGEGRMAEPETILSHLQNFFQKKSFLKGKKILITAGPTLEEIDPVRYISNYSSGKMGLALTRAALEAGASVTLVLGPVHIPILTHAELEVIHVKGAQEMYQAALQHFEKADIGIMAAAVADYRPESIAEQKIKKTGDQLVLKLIKNPDIAAELGRRKRPEQFLVGFALETENQEVNALSKLHKKNLDLIVLNSPNTPGAAFLHDTNQVSLLEADGTQQEFPLKTKDEVALDILNALHSKFEKAS
jgi:phosphopantothenoylcysteine decarboxylase/phosphopantothenate--cysteine ligase